MNKTVLVGRLTKDVEVRKTQTGVSVASFSVAVDRQISKDAQERAAQAGQAVQTADFINCVAWRQQADFLGTYGRKGALVAIEGHLQTQNYQDRNGNTVFRMDVVTDRVNLYNTAPRQNNATGNANAYQTPQVQQAPQMSQTSQMPQAPMQQSRPQAQQTQQSYPDFGYDPSLIDFSMDDIPL